VEKKLIALVFVALLAGLGGGYGLGYTMYYPLIQNLQNELNNLNDKYDTLNSTLGRLDEKVETINSTLSTTKSSVTTLGSELDTLNQNVTGIDSRLNEIETRTWHKASILEGGTVGAVSDKFQIRGNWIRIRWYMYGPAFVSPGEISTVEIPWIQILIKFSNGTTYTHRGSSGVYGSYACDLDIQPGEYFLEVEVYLVDPYLIVVWDYY
jgi:hypothetical protein